MAFLTDDMLGCDEEETEDDVKNKGNNNNGYNSGKVPGRP